MQPFSATLVSYNKRFYVSLKKLTAMKKSFTLIAIAFFVASCSQSKYSNLDAQIAHSSDHAIQAKYNNKNLIEEDKRKKELIKQIAVVTQP